MSKPDWSKGHNSHGGDVHNIPEPHVRRYPHKGVKRRIDVRIDSFVGVCALARHYTPTIEEEANPLWNGECWQSCSNDRDGYGVHIRGPNFSGRGAEAKAREWIQWQLRAYDPEKYEFVYYNGLFEKKPKWFYARDGD